MELNKVLDFSIMADETAKNPDLKAGYVIERDNITSEPYNNYLENDAWKKFVDDMKLNHPTAYKMYVQGGGKELEEREVKGNRYPPKMASFGSSSRMIYNLMKDVDGFLFEKKLPTTVGGIANLDGFADLDDRYVFVEAKCREPYTTKDNKIEKTYEDLYKFISNSNKTNIKIECEPDKTKMKVKFMVGNQEIKHFDIKQMICHLLGVATAFLKEEFELKQIDFVYLLFNPKLIQIKENKEHILEIYESICYECKLVDFKALFDVIFEYLQQEKYFAKNINNDNIVNKFSFRLCNQSDKIL